MDIGELLHKLNERNALIVHFSMQTDRNNGVFFPHDLLHAIALKDDEARSCCVVWPGHNMGLPGEVGVIFRPTAVDQVISLLGGDAGSYAVAGHPDQGGGKPLSRETFEATFDVKPGAYNEWRVVGMDVIGIYVASSVDVQVRAPTQLVLDGDEVQIDGEEVQDSVGPTLVSIDDVRGMFSGLPLVGMSSLGPVRV